VLAFSDGNGKETDDKTREKSFPRRAAELTTRKLTVSVGLDQLSPSFQRFENCSFDGFRSLCYENRKTSAAAVAVARF
jgi:hypothetical protein